MEFLVLVLVLLALINLLAQVQSLKKRTGELERELRGLWGEIIRNKEKTLRQEIVPQPEASHTTSASVAVPVPASERVKEIFKPVEPLPQNPADHSAPPPIYNPLPPPVITPEMAQTTANVPRLKINWEQFMGVKLFAWLGGLALFMGIAFFLKYSFDNNLIPPVMRVSLGFLSGIGLLIGGWWLGQRDYKVTSQTLCATGIVVLYAVTFACRSIYHFELFGPAATLFLLTLVTVMAFALAVRLEAKVIAVLGVAAGFLAPILISTGKNNPLGLFTYVTLLDAGLFAIARRKNWRFLLYLATAGTVFMQAGWVAKFFKSENLPAVLAVFSWFNALFQVPLFLFRKESPGKDVKFSAVTLPIVSLLMSFILLFDTGIKTQPLVYFSLIFLASISLITASFFHRALSWVQPLAGTFVFLLLAIWTGKYLSAELLYWGLGAYAGYSLLHMALPIIERRLYPDEPVAWWHSLFVPLVLLLIMVPITRLSEDTLIIWLLCLFIDALAIAMAFLLGTIVAVAVALCFTIATIGIALLNIGTTVEMGSGVFLLIGVFAVVFIGATSSLQRKISFAQGEVDLSKMLPIASAALPFALLMLAMVKLEMPDPSKCFGLAIVLSLVLLVLQRQLAMPILSATALVASFLLQALWQEKNIHVAGLFVSVAWPLTFCAVFALFPFLFRKSFEKEVLPWAVSAASFVTHFLLVYRAVRMGYSNEFMGLLPALFAIPVFGLLAVITRRFPNESPIRLSQLAWFGGVGLLFVSLIFPLQFEKQWLTVGWALEGAALIWLYHKLPHRGLFGTGLALLLISFIRLALNPAVLTYHERSGTPIFNWHLYTYGIVIAAMFVAAQLAAPPRNRVFDFDARAWLCGMGTILLFVLMNIEVADYFSEGSTFSFKFGTSVQRDLAYTISWGLFGLALVVTGLARELKISRYAGILLLAVCLVKVFFHDLSRLGQLYRIGALIGIAMITILASFLYQRFLRKPGVLPDKLKEL